jgi:light-regulated signal transduction histidine kinase (bacteriophytochrome)
MGMGPFDEEARTRGDGRPRVYAHEALAARFDRYKLTAGWNQAINTRQFRVPGLRWPTEYRYPDVTYRDRWQLEVEPLPAQIALDHRMVHDLMRRIDEDTTIERASTRIARGVRELLGYDRVMIYRFDADWHGEVVAEAVRDGLEPYLGLHYPATDIPAQARALYLRNRVRTIGDVRYTPAALKPTLDPKTGEPVDLSDVALRSVSPVHVEYLSNMGVRATLVASIIVSDQLWGLIACHHYQPLYPQPEEREVADLLARTLAGRVSALQVMSKMLHETRFETIREHLITHFANLPEITPEQLERFSPELLEAVDADGVALMSEGVVGRYGVLPDDAVLVALRRRIVETGGTTLRSDTSGVLFTDAIGDAFPEFADMADVAAGLLYIPLGPSSRSAILWTRVQQLRTVRWGGNPHLAKLQVIAGARLSPRQSFSAWQEDVRGRSLPWTQVSLESARALRVLVEVMDRKHYQADFGVLMSTLDVLSQPMLVLSIDPVSGTPELVHMNHALADLVGSSDPNHVLDRWQLRAPDALRQFPVLQPFFAPTKNALPGSGGMLELRPINIAHGKQNWLGLVESVPG